MNVKLRKMVVVLLCVVYKLLLDYMYVKYLSGSYRFYGFYSDFSVPCYVISWIIFLLIELPLVHYSYNSQTEFSSLLLFVYSLIYFVPFTSMLYAGYKWNFIIYTSLVWLFLVLYTKLLSNRKFKLKIGTSIIGIKKKIAYFGLATISILIFFSVIYLSWRFTGFRLSFDESETYVFRAEAFDYQTSAFWGYLHSWSRLIIPLLLCISIINKKYIFAVGLFFLKMLSFGYDGMRLDLMMTLLAVAIAFFYKGNNRPRELFTILLLGMIGLCVLSIAEHELFNSSEIDRVITFRVLFLPNLIASWFVRFFETHVPDYFRQGFLRYFGFKSPYSSKQLDFIITEFIFGPGEAGRANNGLVADCITNLGMIGFAIQPFIVALWASIIDRISKNMHISIIMLLAVYFAYCLTNNFFMIILFTNGGFIVIIYLAMLGKFCNTNSACSTDGMLIDSYSRHYVGERRKR